MKNLHYNAISLTVTALCIIGLFLILIFTSCSRRGVTVKPSDSQNRQYERSAKRAKKISTRIVAMEFGYKENFPKRKPRGHLPMKKKRIR